MTLYLKAYRFSSGWANDQREYFSFIVSKPIKDFFIYEGRKKQKSSSKKGKYVKGFWNFQLKRMKKYF